nr:DUF4198 domain-containing protein [uncultured Desulfobacter sp.]
MKILGTALVLVLICAAPAWAHDCWLQPDHFKIGLDTLLIIKLLVGHELDITKELVLEKKLTPRLSLLTRDKEVDLLSQLEDKSLPAVNFLPKFTGTGLVVMDRGFTDIVLENDKFSSYIKSEYHSHLLDQVKANPRGKQKEEYARCIKTLVQVGHAPFDPKVAARQIGQKLEILLLSVPMQTDPVRVKVLFDQKPLPKRTVTAFISNQAGMTSQTAVTQENGEAVFENTATGMWLIRLIHLSACKEERDMDWTSYWGAFCFEMA